MPEAVLQAQQEGRLVAFVGAGVSAGPPSGLPLFVPLARQIAEETRSAWDDEQDSNHPDRFLGRLADTRLDVHKLVRNKIAVPGSKPNGLHYSIARLFPSAGHLRIVTTNYDTHLAAAARKVFGTEPETYQAPALPLGRDFTGIVYLHGSVEQEPRHLVATDSDFGHAYLTDAWAARFLQEMFRNFTVLFIGYSHNDVVMTYLARGLAPGSRPRFGFASDNPPREWPGLGIKPICYPSANGHAALGEAVGEWADLTRMGLLDHERRISGLVAQAPPDDQPTRSYLERVVTDGATTALFTRHAKSGEWLEWARSLPLFRGLFQPAGELSPAAEELGRWFADTFAAASPDQGLLTAYQFGGTLHPFVANRVALALWRAPRADAAAIGRWAPVLLASASAATTGTLSMLLSSSRWPDDKNSAPLLLDHLLAPRPALAPRFAAADGRSVDSSIHELAGEDYDLRRAWEEFFRPHLDELAAPTAAMAERHLRAAHLILSSAGTASDRWDPKSFERSGIEPHPQDSPHQPFDLLIDVARDSLASLLETAPHTAAALTTSWASSTVPLLRRLAVYGYTYRRDASPDDKLRWAVSGKLLYDSTVKRELFVLLEQALPGAPSARAELLEEIAEGPQDGPPGQTGDNAAELRAYAVFNLLTWVTAKAPDFTEAQAALDDLTARHPSFRPREHPDLDVVITGGAFSPGSPVTVSQLLQKTAPADVDWMLTYQGEPQPGTWMDRFGLLHAISEATAASPGWGVTITGLLNDKQNRDSDLWPAILEGWQRSAGTFDPELAAGIVAQLDRHQSPYEIIAPAARLLETLAKRPDLPAAVLDQAEEYALKLWNAGNAAEIAAGTDTSAVNLGTIAGQASGHWAWTLVGFWVQDASNRWQKAQDSWAGLPAPAQDALSGMLAAQGFPSLAAASAIGADFSFLLAADEAWATVNVLPAFSWEAGAARAASTWAGHLAYGQWNDRVAVLLQGDFEKCFSRIAPELRVPLAVRVAGISLYGTVDPLTSGLLPDYVSSASEGDLRKFASTVYDSLRKAPAAFAESQWDRWIRDYWLSRIDSVPLPLTPPEAGEMVNWALATGEHAPQAAELSIRTPAEIPSAFLFFRQLQNSSLFTDTVSAALLAAHVLSGATEVASACQDIDQVIRLLADRREAASKGALLDACSHAAKLGCPSALSLQDYVERQFAA